MPVLDAQNITYRIGEARLVDDASLGVEAGSFVGLLGPNGAGKTTLLRLLSGELEPVVGSICLQGKPLDHYEADALGRLRAMLSQNTQTSFPFSVEDIVMMGRIPHLKGMFEGESDRAAVEAAMKRSDVLHLRNRLYPTLSGGEAHRVDVARVLAQDPDLFFLDEPTNHLDPHHQVEVLSLFRELVHEGKTVIAALHDLNLASLFCDRVLMMNKGRIVADAPPAEALSQDLVELVYNIHCSVLTHPSGVPWIVPELKPLRQPNPS